VGLTAEFGTVNEGSVDGGLWDFALMCCIDVRPAPRRFRCLLD
jgi:hypothetical protein